MEGTGFIPTWYGTRKRRGSESKRRRRRGSARTRRGSARKRRGSARTRRRRSKFRSETIWTPWSINAKSNWEIWEIRLLLI